MPKTEEEINAFIQWVTLFYAALHSRVVHDAGAAHHLMASAHGFGATRHIPPSRGKTSFAVSRSHSNGDAGIGPNSAGETDAAAGTKTCSVHQ